MKKLVLMMTLLLIVFVTGCSNGDQVVRLGLLRVPNDAMLAKQMGLFEEKFGALGYDIEYYNFDSGVDANKAVVSGDIDFATMGNINAIVALGNELDAELVWIHETLGEVEALAVTNESGIETVADLEGKRIATTFASTAHYVLLNVLKEEGIEDNVELLNMKTSEIVAAWNRGDIDAAYTWQPSLGSILDQGGSVLVSSADMIEKGYMTANVELARKSFADEHPELVEAYIECMSEAYDYFMSDTTDAINKLADELGLSVEEVELQTSGSIWTSLEEMQSDLFIEGYINTMVEQTVFLQNQDFIDRSIDYDEMAVFINESYAKDVTVE